MSPGQLLQDLHQAVRAILHHRGFAALVVATMALAIGLDTLLFSVVDAFLLRAPPVTAEDRLLNVYSSVPGGFLRNEPMAFPDYEDLRRRARTFSATFAYAWFPLALDRKDGAELVMGELVTGDYFGALGITADRGRLLTAIDDQPGESAAVVVLSYDGWQRFFSGAPDVVDRELSLNGRAFSVVGVAPRGFHGLIAGFSPDLWLPLRTGAGLPTGVTIDLGRRTPGAERLDDRGRRWVWVTGRLGPGISMAAARADVVALGERLAQEYPSTNDRRSFEGVAASGVRMLPGIDGALRLGSAVLLSAFGLVLLLAAVNLASLFLARALARRRGIATRLALGLGRARLVGQLFLEGLLLAVTGALAGFLVAQASRLAVARLQLPLVWPVRLQTGPLLDVRVLVFALAVAALAAVVFALLPALQATRADLATLFRELGGSSPARRQRSLRGRLVGVQVAVCALLLSGAGSAVRSLVAAATADPGFVPRGLAVVAVSPGLVGYGPAELHLYSQRLRERVLAIPGVEQVTEASHLPLTFAVNFAAVAAEGEEGEGVVSWPATDTASVGPGYFETLRVPLIAGRGIEARDDHDARAVAVINETLARRLWPGQEAVGRRLRVAGVEGAHEVVGVARDGKYRSLGEAPRPFVYRALAQDPRGTRTLVVRTAADLGTLLPELQRVARSVEPRVPVARPTSCAATMASSLLLPRAAAVLLGSFGALALLLVVVGIYGTVAFTVSAHRREIGVRVALGAAPRRIIGWLLGRVLPPVAGGLVVGLLGAVAGARALSTILFGLPASEVATPAVVVLVVSLATLMAAYLPARRAAGAPPAQELRRE